MTMWRRIDTLIARAPHVRALRFHRVELLEAHRRRAAGLPPLPELMNDTAAATFFELAVPTVLGRARDAYDGRVLLMKGPEAALDYPDSGLRPFHDLDLLVDDPRAAQAALVAAGFHEVGDPALYSDIHHLRPLRWAGLPLLIELHARPKWPAGIPGPPVADLLGDAVAARVGVTGVEALPAAHHALILAAHAWAHEPLARLGHLVDIAATLARTDRGEADRLARAWGCSRMWRCTQAAVDTVLYGERTSAASAMWARHLLPARERTVFELHVQRWLSPAWGLPRRRVPLGVARAIRDDLRLDGDERWWTKVPRARLALSQAAMARSEHNLALEERGYATTGLVKARSR
jgi:hypothetical protein